MDLGNTAGGSDAKGNLTDASGQPESVQRVAPDAPPPPSRGFAGVQIRPEGQRYGDADLVPGGRLEGSGGMLMNERNFPRPGIGGQGGGGFDRPGGYGGGQPSCDPAGGYARFTPMFPGQQPPTRGGFGGRAPRMPGEPDDDNFFPPGGRPGEPFGGPGGGQFGPSRGGNFGGWGGPGGGGSPWA